MQWRGFELHPETPVGGMRVADLFAGARADAMREQMKHFASSFGVEMNMPEYLPNTRRVLAIAEYAREQGKLDLFREAAMRAHWSEGKNIENEEDLRAIAAGCGLDPDAALRAADDPEYQGKVDALGEEAGRMGVTGIPTLFVGDACVVGCQPYEMIAETARRAGVKDRNSGEQSHE